MPELPDITVYLEHLHARIVGQTLERLDIAKPFVLRSFDPPVSEVVGTTVRGVRRMGKRIVLAMDGDLYIVIHLMIAGRLRWRTVGAKLPPKGSILATFHFPNGVLVLTEAGTTRRASMHLVRGEEGLRAHDRGGLEVLDATLAQFGERLRSENHTLKRSLADPRLFSGIGNAYSDEILHRARLSPVMLTSRLSDDEIARLFDATRSTLVAWTERLRTQAGKNFPEKVTAFHEEMAVHGRFGEPCPVCGT
ncbi:MAG: Fpg/Nei family DNA glycosylase, partial [Gemmatimonadaceae bacterium]